MSASVHRSGLAPADEVAHVPDAAVRLRIAVVVNEFPALSETFILEQITGLIDRGHDVHIFANQPRPESRAHPAVDTYGLRDRCRYFGIPAARFARLRRGAAVAAAAAVTQAPAGLLRCLQLLSSLPTGTVLDLLQVGRVLGGERPPFDVYHCHFGPNGRFLALLKRLGLITGRIVTTFHGYDLSQRLRRGGSGFYDELYRFGDLFLPISRSWQRELVALGCPAAKVRVHHMGIDCRALRFAPRRRAPGEPLRFVTVGRLVEKKGIVESLRALARLRELTPDLAVDYAIVGEGPLGPALVDLASSLGLERSVRFLGPRSGPEVVDILLNAHVFLLPSVTAVDGDMEGIPVSIMEAMATGMPVLSTCHSGIPELVEDRISGRLVPERDIEALAHAMAELARRPEWWPSMGAAGRRAVEERHDSNRLNDRLAGILVQLTAGDSVASDR